MVAFVDKFKTNAAAAAFVSNDIAGWINDFRPAIGKHGVRHRPGLACSV